MPGSNSPSTWTVKGLLSTGCLTPPKAAEGLKSYRRKHVIISHQQTACLFQPFSLMEMGQSSTRRHNASQGDAVLSVHGTPRSTILISFWPSTSCTCNMLCLDTWRYLIPAISYWCCNLHWTFKPGRTTKMFKMLALHLYYIYYVYIYIYICI